MEEKDDLLVRLQAINKHRPDVHKLTKILSQMMQCTVELPSWSMSYIASAGLNASLHKPVVDLFMMKSDSRGESVNRPPLFDAVVDCAYNLKSLTILRHLVGSMQAKLAVDSQHIITLLAIARAVWRSVQIEINETPGHTHLRGSVEIFDVFIDSLEQRLECTNAKTHLLLAEEKHRILKKLRRFCIHDKDHGECRTYYLFFMEILRNDPSLCSSVHAMNTLIRSCVVSGNYDVASVYYNDFLSNSKGDERVLATYCHVSVDDNHVRRCSVEIFNHLNLGLVPSIRITPAIVQICLKSNNEKILLKALNAVIAGEANSNPHIFPYLNAIAKIGYCGFEGLLKYCVENDIGGLANQELHSRLLLSWIPKSLHPEAHIDLANEYLHKDKLHSPDDVITSLMLFYLKFPGNIVCEVYKRGKMLGETKILWVMLLLRWAENSLYFMKEEEKAFVLEEVKSHQYTTVADQTSAGYSVQAMCSYEQMRTSLPHQKSSPDLTSCFKYKYEYLRNFSSLFSSEIGMHPEFVANNGPFLALKQETNVVHNKHIDSKIVLRNVLKKVQYLPLK